MSFIENVTNVLRGTCKGLKFNSVGNLLRVEKGVRILKKNANIEVGNRVFIHRDVKLSAGGIKDMLR